MTKPASGLRDRRGRDVMELLAQARPASLDPAGDDPAQARAAARILVAGAPPVTTGPAAPDGTRRAGVPGPVSRPRRRRALLAGTGLTATAAGTALAVALATGGGQPQAVQKSSAVLTAAMVRHVASASALALATSGRAVTRYRTSQDGAPQVSGTDDMTFAGKNWNDSLSQSFPASSDGPASSQHAVNRVVDGTFYLFTIGANGTWEWIRDTNPSGHPNVAVPDPRKLLAVLTPAAKFEVIGHQTVDGVELTGLRATDLRHLPRLDALSRILPGGHVTALTVWVDGHDVVRLVDAATRSVSMSSGAAYKKAANGHVTILVPDEAVLKRFRARLAKKNPEHMSVRIDHHLRATHHREVQLSMVSVAFSGIGQPQHITAPKHSVAVYGRG